MDIFDIAPHVVSRDLRGYQCPFLWRSQESGKTTIASKFPKSLLVAFEKGYAALPGVMAAPVNTWSDFIKILKQLKEEKAQELFETIIIDTADIAYDYCEQYICSVNSVDTINKIPFGQGFTLAGKEFDSKLRQIVQMGYGLVLISHAADKTFKDETGIEYNKIVPTLGNKPRLICSRLCDIIAYSRVVETPEGNKTMLFMRGTPRFEAGSRFKHTPDYIDFNYHALVEAIGDAIDKQAAEDGVETVTTERQNLYKPSDDIDFDAVMTEFGVITGELMTKDAQFYGPRITEIVEARLGKGKKVSECARDQAQIIDIIVYEIKELV